MALTLKQVKDVCLLSGSAQCRYLAEDDDVPNKYYCLKLVQKRKDEIDDQVDDFIKKQKAKGVDPKTLSFPIGNNCSGYRCLTTKMQGYDLDQKP